MSRYDDRLAAMAKSPSDNPFGRQLPVNMDAEMALLGALLVNNAAYNAVLPTGIEARHFSEPIHRTVFEAAKACIAAGKIANPVTIRSFISPDILNQPVGDITVGAYTARLCSEATSIVNAPDYAAGIMFYSHRRDVLPAANILESAAYNSEDELAFVDQIREARDRLTNTIQAIEGSNADASLFANDIDDTLNRTDDAAHGRGALGIDPGIHELRTLTGPWQKGQLIIIGAGVKQGKTALAMQSMFTIAETRAVGCNSGEMSKMQLIMREKARRTGISAMRQQRGNVSEYEFQELVRAGAEMKHLKPVSIDCRRMTLQQVEAHIGRLINEIGIEAYFLDHIGKLQWSGKMEFEEEHKKAAIATSLLKDMAMKFGIPIIALTHLKKNTFDMLQGRTFSERLKQAQNRRPTYQNLLGNLDKDADFAIIPFHARPIIAGLEPEEDTSDYNLWKEAMEKVEGKAEIILALARDTEFPRRQQVTWNGATTSYGAPFKQVQNDRELF